LYTLTVPPLAEVAALVGVAVATLIPGMAVFNRLERRLAEHL